jgi:Baseplate J-like protein
VSVYQPPAITTSSSDLEQAAFDVLEEQIPGWTPREGNLDVVVIESVAPMAEDVAALATNVPDAIILYLGQLLGIAPKPGTPASCTAQVTALDDAGYTMPAGTQFSITDATGTEQGFATLSDQTIPAAATQMDVPLVANENGVAASGISPVLGSIMLLDPLSWVQSVQQLTTTSGGSDDEAPDLFLDRLTGELRLMAPRPILPGDFAAMARTIPGIDRTLALDLYQPGTGQGAVGPPVPPAPPLPTTPQTGVERCCTVVCAHADGSPAFSSELEAAQALLASQREATFLAYTMPPGSQSVTVDVHAVRETGWAASDVHDAIIAALSSWLSPASFGAPDSGNDPGNWLYQSAIRWSDAVQIANATDGVDHLVTLYLDGSQQDVILASPINLPAATITATVDDPS